MQLIYWSIHPVILLSIHSMLHHWTKFLYTKRTCSRFILFSLLPPSSDVVLIAEKFANMFRSTHFCIVGTLLLQFVIGLNQFEPPHKRFEYKHSFKGPYLGKQRATGSRRSSDDGPYVSAFDDNPCLLLCGWTAQKDGTVPFWVYEGNAIASEEMVRITPSLRSKKGSIWTKEPFTSNYWEVELWFRVTGRGRLGADGLGFFFTESKLAEGPVFGSADNWNGLGIFFDSFDNDGK